MNQECTARDYPHNELLRSQSAYSYFTSCNDENNLGTHLDNAVCFMCRNLPKAEPKNSCKRCGESNNVLQANNHTSNSRMESEGRCTMPMLAIEDNTTPAYSIYENRKPCRRKRIDVITSFTDSPLFSRKYRFGRHQGNAENRLPGIGAVKAEGNGFNLVKHIAEARWKRKETKNHGPLAPEESKSAVNSNVHATRPLQTINNLEIKSTATRTPRTENTIEATPVEARSSVSLHAQVKCT